MKSLRPNIIKLDEYEIHFYIRTRLPINKRSVDLSKDAADKIFLDNPWLLDHSLEPKELDPVQLIQIYWNFRFVKNNFIYPPVLKQIYFLQDKILPYAYPTDVILAQNLASLPKEYRDEFDDEFIIEITMKKLTT